VKAKQAHSPHLVVGIGASAGGLEALKALFAAIPAKTGMAFVVIQHLEPSHASRMAEILSTHTAMKVSQAVDGETLEPDRVYTNPSNMYVSCRGDALRLEPPAGEHGLRMPIDHFLRSLAEDRRDRSAGIILSGSGSDGTIGLGALQEARALTIAQLPSETSFAAMPEHAIESGHAGFVLPLNEIPARLIAFSRRVPAPAPAAGPDGTEALEEIITLLRAACGFDFTPYKRGTIRRRVERRMDLGQTRGMAEYRTLLEESGTEREALVRDLMIGVTRFFREPAAFEELREKALLPLIAERNPAAPIRIWVPGCSTGEEAYSVAMLVSEGLAAADVRSPVQIFATDIDTESLEAARDGTYPAAIAADVSAERRERFFTAHGDYYRVRRDIRERVVFAVHNLLTDPPFSRLDLVSCRNVLIYLGAEAQRKVLSFLAMALNPGGSLFLGASDSAAHEDTLFAEVSRTHGLYRRTMTQTRPTALYSMRMGGKGPLAAAGVPPVVDFTALNARALVKRFSACIILAETGGQILQIEGPASRYLDFPSGKPTLNLFSLAPEPLSIKLRAAAERATRTGEDVRMARVSAARGAPGHVEVTVSPLSDEKTGAKMVAVIITDAPGPPAAGKKSAAPPREASAAAQLREELASTREDLQSLISRLEGTNEDLTAANEEVMSMNEELQSTVEELETAKEEGLSVNEELTTVNAELRDRAEQLRVAHDDLSNFFNATTIVTVLLDRALRLRRYTANASDLFRLSAADLGRPLAQIFASLERENLERDAEKVLRDLVPLEREIQTAAGAWHTVRILPYRTADDRVDGVVLTMTDVSRLKHAEEFAESIIATVRSPLLVVDRDMRIVSANAACHRVFETAPEEVRDAVFYSLGSRGWDTPALRAALAGLIAKGGEIQDLPVKAMLKGPVPRTMLLSARRIQRPASQPPLVLIALEDITGRLQLEEARRLAALQITETEIRERKRFSRILHDQVQQFIVAAKTWLGDARERTVSPEQQAALAKAEDHLAQALQVSRSLAAELSPPILASGGISRALDWLVRQMQESYGLSLALSVDPAAEPEGDGLKTFIFWSIRELLFNVVRHAGVKKASVEVFREGEHIRARVIDAGSGIDAARREAIESGIAGFGLSSMRERLSMLGGDMRLAETPGGGTTVTLSAPGAGGARGQAEAAQPAVPSVPASDAAAAEELPSPPQGAPAISVLLVDDHSIVRQGIAQILQKAGGIQVAGEAADGIEAVEQARRLRPDVIVMDLTMPRMGGEEATRAIMAELPRTRIIVLSMHLQDELGAAMRDAGAVAYLTKGGPSGDLVNAIRKVAARQDL
jgi:two-component system, chemotaxis family, CheB/CheR fusion protein